MLRFLLCPLVALIACNAAQAGTDECFAHAAQRRNINVNLLRAIGKVESNYRPYVTNADTNAIGVMQIMPFHLNWLKKYGIYERDLFDACTNINVGAFLLADFIRMYGDTWRAVGAYGAGIKPDKEQARIKYARLVQATYERITQKPSTSPVPAHSSRTADPVQPERPTLVVQQ